LGPEDYLVVIKKFGNGCVQRKTYQSEANDYSTEDCPVIADHQTAITFQYLSAVQSRKK
jgi:hypothetical protein